MVSESNLSFVRRRGGRYIVGTPKASLRTFEAELVEQEDWDQVEAGVEDTGGLDARQRLGRRATESSRRAHQDQIGGHCTSRPRRRRSPPHRATPLRDRAGQRADTPAASPRHYPPETPCIPTYATPNVVKTFGKNRRKSLSDGQSGS